MSLFSFKEIGVKTEMFDGKVTATAALSPGIAFADIGRVIVTRGEPLPPAYICRNYT